jgi:TRAP-type transport system periplasmic protein
LLAPILLSAATLSGAPLSTGVAQSQELKISHQFPAEVDSRDRAARMFIAEVLKRAPHLKLSLHPASSLKIEPVAQMGALASGELAMSIFPLIYAVGRAPEMAITMFPFVPADLEMAAQLRGTPFEQKLQVLAEANGVRILTWWWMPGGIASHQHEIGGPQTVKGLKLSLPEGGFERMFALAGARDTTLVPSPYARDAMRDGKLDGTLTSLESLVNMRMYEQSKSATIGGIGNFMNLQPLMISKVVWDGLAIDEKSALEAAAEATNGYFASMQREAEQNAIAAFTKAGASVHRLDIDEYEAWTRIAKDTVWPEYRKLSPVANELFVALLTSLIQSGKADKASPTRRSVHGD